MNSIRNKLGVLIIIAFAVVITGCAEITSITRETHRVDHQSKVEAAKELPGRRVYFLDEREERSALLYIGPVSETGFDYGEWINIEDSRRVVGQEKWGNRTETKYEVRSHNVWKQYGTMSFAEITKIEQRKYSISNPIIDLYGKDGRLVCIIQTGFRRDKDDRVVSALLLLSPNVK